MTAVEKAPECEHDMHQLCAGPLEVRREGAPVWEAPVEVLRCGCVCHRKSTRTGRQHPQRAAGPGH